MNTFLYLTLLLLLKTFDVCLTFLTFGGASLLAMIAVLGYRIFASANSILVRNAGIFLTPWCLQFFQITVFFSLPAFSLRFPRVFMAVSSRFPACSSCFPHFFFPLALR
jgi:hypothetical protein